MTWNKGKTWEEQGIVGEKKAKRLAHLRKIASMGGKASSHNEKPVFQLDEDGKVLAAYCSAAEAGRVFGVYPQNICKVCNGKGQHCAGYRWAWDTRKLNY